MKNYAIVLAAGQGTRMHVDSAKCAQLILKKPMVQYVLDTIDNTSFYSIYLVVDHKSADVFKNIISAPNINYVIQEKVQGTANAISYVIPQLDDFKGYTLILPGDVPLINKSELQDFINYHLTQDTDISLLTTIMKTPSKYGRVLRNAGDFVKIKEYNEASEDELLIHEINTGIYLINNDVLLKLFKENPDILQLPALLELAKNQHFKISTYTSKHEEYYYDVNDFYTLSQVENFLKISTNRKHLLNGVNIISPETVTISSEVTIEPGVIIYPNTFLTGNTKISAGAQIGPDSELHNAIIKENACIRHSLITNSSVGKNTTIGPFAHLRDNTIIGDNCRIGNYVEIKNSFIDNETKIAHLTYIGDTTCGKNVNWGCGSVTVNYDGKNKNRTEIGDNVFIGCNTNLIAPIKVGKNAFIAAGSTITDDVPSEAFSIARERQVTKEDYAKKYLKK